MIAKTFTPFSGVQPFTITGFPQDDGTGTGRGLPVRQRDADRRPAQAGGPGAGRRRDSGEQGVRERAANTGNRDPGFPADSG